MKAKVAVLSVWLLAALFLVGLVAAAFLSLNQTSAAAQSDGDRQGSVLNLPNLKAAVERALGPRSKQAATHSKAPGDVPPGRPTTKTSQPTQSGTQSPTSTSAAVPTDETATAGPTDGTTTPQATATPSKTVTPTQTLPGDSQPTLPIRAAFYYPWFPQAWTQKGVFPYTNYSPSLGTYDSADEAVIRDHVAAMQYGNIQAGIASWWGQGHHTDSRMPTILSATAGSSFRWSIYYEPEGQGNPSASQITADLTYLRDHYGNDPSYLRIDGRFVVFVYADASDGCGMADRWEQANTVNAYVVLKVFSGYRACASQPDGWHQYGPAVAADAQDTYSYSISPGFWKVNESPRLSRSLTRWNKNIRDMIASGADFQLITTFNEWGEGTSVESALEWQSASGYGAYLDALHQNGGMTVTVTPPASATVSPTKTPTTSSATVTPTKAPTPTAPPAPSKTPAPGTVVFSAAGDHGATSRTNATLSRMNTLGLQFHLALGDLSYDDRTPESAWCDYIKAALGTSFPFQLVGGNHEEDSRINGYIQNFAACLPDRMGSVGNYPMEYYFDSSGIVRVIVIGADLKVGGESYDYVPGNPHYQWLSDAIDDARAQGIPWVVVAMHKVCLSMGNKPCEVGDPLMNLLIDEKRVDLVLMAHDHDYQRSKQLTCSTVGSYSAACVADDGSDGQYSKGAGTVIVITGTFGGGGFTSVSSGDSEAGYFAAWMGGNDVCRPSCTAADRGVVRYTLTATTLSAEFFTNSGDYSDSFTIH